MPLDAEWHIQLGLDPEIRGVVVTAIAEDSPFVDADIEPGDVIEAIDRQAVTSTRDAVAKLKAALRRADAAPARPARQRAIHAVANDGTAAHGG